MSKPTKSLKTMCKKLGVRLTIKRGQKRVYKSVAVLKKQCAKKKKARGKRKVKRRRRRRRFGTHLTAEQRADPKVLKGLTRFQAIARGYQNPVRKLQRRKEKAIKEAERRRRMMYALGAGAAGLGVGAGLGGYAGYHYRPRRRFGRKRGKGFIHDPEEDYGGGSVYYAPKIQRRYEEREKARMSAARRAKLMKYLKYAGLGTAGLGTAGLGGYAGYRYYKRRRGKKKKGKKKK